MGGKCARCCASEEDPVGTWTMELKPQVVPTADVIFDEATGVFTGTGGDYYQSEPTREESLEQVMPLSISRCGTGGTSERDLGSQEEEEAPSPGVKTGKRFSGITERHGALTRNSLTCSNRVGASCELSGGYSNSDSASSSQAPGQRFDSEDSGGKLEEPGGKLGEHSGRVPRFLSVTISKASPTEKLGFSVGYQDGQLTVIKVHPNGALARQRGTARGSEFQKIAGMKGPVVGKRTSFDEFKGPAVGKRSSFGALGLKAQITAHEHTTILTGDILLSVNGAEDIETINRYMLSERGLVIQLRR